MEQAPGHVIPKGTVIATYVGLVVLAAVMIGISRLNVEHFQSSVDWLDLHALKAWIIMGIALMMGIITAMFLMGLAYEHKLLNITIFISNFVFLLIFVVFTWADTSFRGEVDPTFTKKINFTSPVHSEAPEHEAAPAH
jgi:caa(3)-type oxidase subunit IV